MIADTSLLDNASEWASLQGLVRIKAERYHKVSGQTERRIRYHITSLKPDAARLNRVIRQHCGIEDKLHGILDVGFWEDASRKRAGNAVHNFSLLNRIALSLRQETSLKRGIKKGNDLRQVGIMLACSSYSESDMRRPWVHTCSARCPDFPSAILGF